MRFFIFTQRGLEDVALEEMRAYLKTFTVVAQEYRRIIFDYDGEPLNLLKLRCIDDVFIFIKTFTVDHYRESLHTITQKMCRVKFDSYLKTISMVRDIGKNIRYSITASNIGKKNYKLVETKDTVAKIIENSYDWRRDDDNYQDVNVRIYIEHDYVLTGIRLGLNPLHRRPYKTNSLPGSLKASVASCLLRMANVRTNSIVVDPMCGVGTIPIEAAIIGANANGGDISLERIGLAKENCSNANVSVDFKTWDARDIKLDDNFADAIVSNLPFDRQITIDCDEEDFFINLLNEFNRILKNNGRMVLLALHHEIIKNVISKINSLKILEQREISLFGLKPNILVIEKV